MACVASQLFASAGNLIMIFGRPRLGAFCAKLLASILASGLCRPWASIEVNFRGPVASIYFLAICQHASIMSDSYPSRTAEKIVVRLPDGMRDKLAIIAKENGRSVNAEVVLRLGLTLTEVGNDMNAFGMGALIKRLEAHVHATEAVAHRMFYELYLANGVGLGEVDRITKAVDAFIETRPDPITRPQAVRAILVDWLTGHGFLKHRDDPEGAN